MMGGENNRGLLQRLRSLIGRDCQFLGKRCRLVEILTDEGVLILETHERLPPIQTDQYGQAAYRANETMQVPIFGRDGASFSEEIMDLFSGLSPRGADDSASAVYTRRTWVLR
jgi:hypothetical protein